MAGIEKLITNGIQTASHVIQKIGNATSGVTKEMGTEKLTKTLDGIAATNSALIKNSLSDTKDFSLLSGKRIRTVFCIKDKTGNTKKIPSLFDADNSKAIPLQGHKSGLGLACPEIPDYPIQEAWYKLRLFLRDLQHNNGTFSDETKNLLCDLDIKEDDIMKRIADNLEKQKQFMSNLKPSTSECILYRHINCDNILGSNYTKMLDGFKPGEIYILDYAPIHAAGDIKFIEVMSESSLQETVNIIRIKTPKGSKLISGKPVEDSYTEIIFPSKSVFKFIDKKTCNGLNVWDFEYILPD